MNRRNFFKFFGKGAAIAATAAVIGLPEVDDKNKLIQAEEVTPLIVQSKSINFATNGTLYISGQFTNAGPGADLPYIGASLEQWQKMVEDGNF